MRLSRDRRLLVRRRRFAFVLWLAFAACQPRSTSRVGESIASRVDAAVAPAISECRSFGGRIHGATRCVHLDFASGAVAPIAERPAGPRAECGKELHVGRARLVVVCDSLGDLPPDAGRDAKSVRVSVDVFDPQDAAAPTRVVLDRFDGFWDFIVVWVRESAGGADLAIDYGVLD